MAARVIPLVIIARLHAREGREADAHAALAEAQRATHQEPGCRLYALHVDRSDPGAFVMIEGWESDQALEDHRASPHIRALMAKSEAIFDRPVELQRLTALPAGDSGKGEL